MKHVAPHLWADAFAGKLADDERRRDRPSRRCLRALPRGARSRRSARRRRFPRCARNRRPSLGWDSIRARVHWSVSTERHEKIPSAARTRAR